MRGYSAFLIQQLTKLANSLDHKYYIDDADFVDDLIHKIAASYQFYHGTSSVFLRSILKQGLVPKPPTKVWSEDWKRDPGNMGLESYPGVYTTTNFMKAYSSAGDAMRKFGGNRLIIIGKIEDKSPEARLDEDLVNSPATGFARRNKWVFDWHTISSLLDNVAFDSSPEEIKEAVKTWIKEDLKIKDTPQLLALGEELVRAWLDMEIALRIEREKDDNWQSTLMKLKARFNENIPKIYFSPKEAIQKYRQVFDKFLAKAKELIKVHRELESQYSINVHNIRLDKSISYKGANKIEAIVEIVNSKDFSKPSQIIIHYSTNPNAINTMLDEYRKSVGSFII